MCRSILTLRDKEFTDADVHAAALQFVRKLSGYRKPSQANTEVFDRAVEEIAIATERMLASLETQQTRRGRVA
ncbi:MAG: hypothetical protein JW395_4094 [Nitrospira sp.]|nr:hypothetical protein [Nitrospira sp.]